MTSSSAPDAAERDLAPGKRRDVHCVMQGKGGVGKSFIASLLIQWHQANNLPVMAFDTDPVNRTLSSFPALAATQIRLLNEDKINTDGVDELIEAAVTGSGASVIDNGSASFLPMARYLVSNDIAAILEEHDRRLVLHTVVVGGQAALDTLRGMVALLGQFPPGVPVIVWVNEYNGRFDADGLSFEETRAYQGNAGRIAGVVHLAPLDPLTHGRDVETMLARQVVFADAIASPEFKIVAKSRLSQVRRAVFEQLDAVMGAI